MPASCLLLRVGHDWVVAVFGHFEGHFVRRGIYFVAWRDFEEGVNRFSSFDIGQSGDVFHLFPRIRKNFEDRCGEIVGGPRLCDSYGFSVPIAVALGAEVGEAHAASGDSFHFAVAKILDGNVWRGFPLRSEVMRIENGGSGRLGVGGGDCLVTWAICMPG